MSVATTAGAIPWSPNPGEGSGTPEEPSGSDNLWLVLSIEQGRELANVLTELPAPVGDGLVHGQDPICPQDPDTVHVGQSRSELTWLLRTTVVMVEDLTRTSVDLAGDRPVAGLGPVVSIAQRWSTMARALLV